MNDNEIFIESKLPKPLKRSELIEYKIQAREGDLEARDKVIVYNIRLVLRQVLGKFASFPYEKKELVSIGILGLIKAVDTFDVNKGFDFSTYAIKCINNEIYMFLRQKEKWLREDSLEKTIDIDKNGKEIKLLDVLVDPNSNIVDEIANREILLEVSRQVDMLEEGRNKEITKLYFGFYDDKSYSQQEIANMYGLAQCQVSRIVNSTVNLIANNLLEQNYIEKVKRSIKVKRLR